MKKNPCENCQTLAKLNGNQAKTIAELKDSLFQYGIENTKLQIQREEQEATITKLTGALKDIYSVTNELQVMSIVITNLPTPRTIPPKEKTDE